VSLQSLKVDLAKAINKLKESTIKALNECGQVNRVVGTDSLDVGPVDDVLDVLEAVDCVGVVEGTNLSLSLSGSRSLSAVTLTSLTLSLSLTLSGLSLSVGLGVVG
jgi:hypothetical protein